MERKTRDEKGALKQAKKKTRSEECHRRKEKKNFLKRECLSFGKNDTRELKQDKV